MFMAIVTVLIIEFKNASAFLIFSLIMGALSQLKEIAERVFYRKLWMKQIWSMFFLYLSSSLHSHFQVLFL